MDFDINTKPEKKEDAGENMKENLNSPNYYSSSSKEIKFHKSLFQILTDKSKSVISTFLLNNLSLIYDINSKIKRSVAEVKLIPQTNGISIIPVTRSYLNYIDIILALLVTENEEIINISKKHTEIYSSLIKDVLDHPYNSFLQNKILKVFEILFMNNSFEDLRSQLLNTNCFDVLFSINYDGFIDKEKKCISNNLKSLPNQAQIMKLLNYVYLYISSHEERKEIYSKNEHFVNFELNLLAYLQISNADLLSKEIQSENDLKNSGDEKITFHKNFYDSEAFLFTTKGLLEKSKKLNQRLKLLDDALNK